MSCDYSETGFAPSAISTSSSESVNEDNYSIFNIVTLIYESIDEQFVVSSEFYLPYRSFFSSKKFLDKSSL